MEIETLEERPAPPIAGPGNPREQPRLKHKFQLLEDLGARPPAKDWLVKNVVALRETSSWIAPPGAMKSALLCELAFAVAAGTDWHGHRAKKSGAVVYFALERSDLVKRRLRAYLERSGIDHAPPIAIVPGTVDLKTEASVRDIVATIRAVSESTEQAVVLIVFDTFAKLIAAGGGNEDKAQDQGIVFANLERVVGAIGAHVALVGHTGKDETRGARGSSAFQGHVDVEVTISGETVRTATVTKANDAPGGPLFSFASEVHDFGCDDDGDPITVNVVSGELTPDVPARSPRGKQWPKGLLLVRDAIAAALDGAKDHRVGGDGPPVRAVSVKAARAIHDQRYVSGGDGDRDAAERQAWGRNLRKAREDGLIGGEYVGGEELIWLTSTA